MIAAVNTSSSVKPFVFKGAEESPFLAPRGVYLHNTKLIVSDTGQNRIFIWNQLPESLNAAPDVILGQTNVREVSRNNDRGVSGSTLLYPSGVWTDGNRLIVADAWNHRVLIWLTFPSQNGQPADVVVGQPDFNSNQPNVNGIGKAPSSRSLYWCYGVEVHDGKLLIADTGNRRVLVFNTIPAKNYVEADAVIGAADFEQRDYDPEQAVWPYSVKVSDQGEVAITDTQYFRVLLYTSVERAAQGEKPVIIGQPALEANGQNQFQLNPDANTLSWCYDSHFYNGGIWVCDTGNSRLLNFTDVPALNNTAASSLIGQKDFRTGSENPDTVRTTDNSLYWPFALSIWKHQMAVADTGNHRIVFFNLDHRL